MSDNEQAPATKAELRELESRMLDGIREFITSEFREQYISDTKVLHEDLVHDFRGIFNDRTQQHSDKLIKLETEIEAIKLHLGLLS
jgi:hypothetical protein